MNEMPNLDDLLKMNQDIDKDRGTGRTTALIDSMPDDVEDYIVIVANTIAVATWIKKEVEKVKPKLKGKIQTASVNTVDKLRGLWSDRIFIDHTAFESDNKEFIDFVRMLYAQPKRWQDNVADAIEEITSNDGDLECSQNQRHFLTEILIENWKLLVGLILVTLLAILLI